MEPGMRFLYALAERYYGVIHLRIERDRMNLVFPELGFNGRLAQMVKAIAKPEKLFTLGAVYDKHYFWVPRALKIQICYEAFKPARWEGCMDGRPSFSTRYLNVPGGVSLAKFIRLLSRE